MKGVSSSQKCHSEWTWASFVPLPHCVEWMDPFTSPCISKGCCVTSVPYSAHSSSLLLSAAPPFLVHLPESPKPTLRRSNAGILPICSVGRRARMDDFEAVILEKGTYFLAVPGLHLNFPLFQNRHCHLRMCCLYCTCSWLAPINTSL